MRSNPIKTPVFFWPKELQLLHQLRVNELGLGLG